MDIRAIIRPGRLGLYREAHAASSMVLVSHPESSKALYRRGTASLAMLDYEEALGDLRQAAKLEPKDRAIRRKVSEAQKGVKAAAGRERKAFGALFGRGGAREGSPQGRR